tara:strand:+ start:54 stop:551 length:498 start_codon:yes stop_codon:yes gene_type:complete
MSWQNILKVDVGNIDQKVKMLIRQEFNKNMKNDIKSYMESTIAQGKIPSIVIRLNPNQQDNQMKSTITGTTYIIGALSHGAMEGANTKVIMQEISPLLNAEGYQTAGPGMTGALKVQLSPEKVKQVRANNPTMMRNLSAKVGNILSRNQQQQKLPPAKPEDMQFA